MKRTKIHINRIFLLIALAATVYACVDPFDFSSETFEDALVVSAVITNEAKQQEIVLSRTFPIDQDELMYEMNANVRILDDLGTSLEFLEADPGRYITADTFSIALNREYKLEITLANGQSYSSNFQATPQPVAIDEVVGNRITKENGINGVSIQVNSFDPTGDASYFRYQYKETYKLIAPEWNPLDLDVFYEGPDCFIVITQRPQDQLICYVSPSLKNSNTLDISNFSEGRVSNHEVRFLASNNYKMASRYSILVKQFVQTRDAFIFFETLDRFASEGNLFTQLQAGFIDGNIVADGNPNEKVLGFFEVSSVAEKRYFFNYSDFYPNENLPAYFSACVPTAPDFFDGEFCGELVRLLEEDIVVYFGENTKPTPDLPGPYLVVPRICGDCTSVGTPEIPDFWIE